MATATRPTSGLTNGQLAVLKAFHDFERPMTDEVLAVWVHHFAQEPMSSSGIRSRRAELSRPDGKRPALIEAQGTRRTRTRKAVVHGLTPAGETLARSLF